MRTTYRTTRHRDGSVTVESHGPISRAWRASRVVWACLWLLGALIAAVHGSWSTAGFALLVGTIILPSMRRRAT